MTARRPLAALLAAVVVALVLGTAPSAQRAQPAGAPATTPLPPRLSDEEFWRLSTSSSEPNGFFRSDNLTSNEMQYQYVIPDLVSRVRPGGVYLGVGPEQNYTYIVATKPALVVIFDVRRGNMLLQLMYKAIFEMAQDRADFLSILFSRPRPDGLSTTTSVTDLLNAFKPVPPNVLMFRDNLAAIKARLTDTHGFGLGPSDLAGIQGVFTSFYGSGFALRAYPQYDDLMTATDMDGAFRSYLATETAWNAMKDLETRNLVVPIVGDFAGPKAIRAVGIYLKEHGATVSTFYLSNVEQYLYQDNKWGGFCRNAATLPLDRASTFIRTTTGGGVGFRGPGFVSSLGVMQDDLRSCVGG